MTGNGDITELRALLERGLRAHRSGDLNSAERTCTEVLARAPDQPDALNLMADIARRHGDPDRALDYLNRALASQPGHSSTRFARASLLLAGNRPDQAEQDLRVLVKQQPEQVEAWGEMARSLQLQGRLDEALTAARRAVRLSPRHAGFRINLGMILEGLGRTDEAADAYREAIGLDARSAAAWNNLGNALGKLDRFDEAEAAFHRALEFGEQPLIRTNLAAVLKRCGRLDEAAEACRRALDAAPDSIEIRVTLAAIENDRDQPERAEEVLRPALARNPDHPHALNNLALALQRLNRTGEAISAWQHALEIRPEYASTRGNLAALFEALGRLDEARTTALAGIQHAPDHPQLNWVLARCDRRADRPEVGLERLERLSGTELSARWRQSIEFERGRILDRLGRTSEAWDAFAAGNRAARERWEMRCPGPNPYRRELEDMSAYLGASRTRQWSELPPPADDRESPVFLVGFPRSGTTLLDQMLNAHPDVTVIEEGPMLAEALARIETMPDGYPGALDGLDEGALNELRAAYFSALDGSTAAAASTILVDKLPLNAARAPLIHRLFPNPRFILALRHPADACLSCFMQEFGFNDAMANFFDIEDTVSLYRLVMDIWQRSTELLRPRVHTVRYEELVADPETQARALLGFLELDWDERVLDTAAEARRRGRINTPSYHQVTRPIYTGAVDRWRRYRAHLEPWLPVLAPYATRHDYRIDMEG